MVVVGTFRDEDKPSEVSVTLSVEMFPGEWVTGLFEDVTIEFFVLFRCDVFLITNPQGFVLVDSFEFTSLDHLCCGSVD